MVRYIIRRLLWMVVLLFLVSLITFFVWLISGAPSNLWFLWIVAPYGLILLGRWISGDAPRRDRHRDRRRDR